jgi:myosin heavy subunit
MEAGAHVWCDDKDGEDAWILAEVVKKTEKELQLQLVDNPSKKISRPVTLSDEETGEIKYQGVELANAVLSDQERAEGRDNDLITLPHLHEPALLHAITERFFSGKIYTWTGPVLIAVNPFQRLPLYTSVSRVVLDRLTAGNKGSFLDLDAHVVAFHVTFF